MNTNIWTEKVWQIDVTPTGETEKGSNKFFDSQNELNPLQVYMYSTREGDVRIDFSSVDKRDENKRFEFIINGDTHSIIKFKLDPFSQEEIFVEVQVSRDELKECLQKTKKSNLIFRLKRCE